MREYMDLDSSPCDEEGAQVGQPDYTQRAQRECRAYINQIIRMHGPVPEGIGLRIANNPHDFGTYYTVRVYFNTDNAEQKKWAYKVEAGLPAKWDYEAKRELLKLKSLEVPVPPLSIGAVFKAEAKDRVIQDYAEKLDLSELEAMVLGNSDCIAADGCTVDPDGSCPHGYPSPLRTLGLI